MRLRAVHRLWRAELRTQRTRTLALGVMDLYLYVRDLNLNLF